MENTKEILLPYEDNIVAWSELPEPYIWDKEEPLPETLKPCPVCGERSALMLYRHRIANRYIGGTGYSIKCEKCGTESGCFISAEKAVIDWNNREE